LSGKTTELAPCKENGLLWDVDKAQKRDRKTERCPP